MIFHDIIKHIKENSNICINSETRTLDTSKGYRKLKIEIIFTDTTNLEQYELVYYDEFESINIRKIYSISI